MINTFDGTEYETKTMDMNYKVDNKCIECNNKVCHINDFATPMKVDCEEYENPAKVEILKRSSKTGETYCILVNMKRCPMCNSDKIKAIYSLYPSRRYSFKCTNCGIKLDREDYTFADAIELWNRKRWYEE